jgi:hypothetical protein
VNSQNRTSFDPCGGRNTAKVPKANVATSPIPNNSLKRKVIDGARLMEKPGAELRNRRLQVRILSGVLPTPCDPRRLKPPRVSFCADAPTDRIREDHVSNRHRPPRSVSRLLPNLLPTFRPTWPRSSTAGPTCPSRFGPASWRWSGPRRNDRAGTIQMPAETRSQAMPALSRGEGPVWVLPGRWAGTTALEPVPGAD